jgi:phosphatidylserine/phosphatidylglycerophosphate/cardiolipin synthase-like enzyme
MDFSRSVSYNNRLKMFICGQEGFAAIAESIKAAKESIDLVCWGFDPGMELVRNESGEWPRGQTYGDLLIDVCKKNPKLKVRLLVWYDRGGALTAKNMPGYSHDTHSWYYRGGKEGAAEINAMASVSRLRDALQMWPKPTAIMREGDYADLPRKLNDDEISRTARQEYCHSWYKAARQKLLAGIELRVRSGDRGKIVQALEAEPSQPAGLTKVELEAGILEHFGSHHQKTVLIDYAYKEGFHAVGFVIGLNSVTDYWDTTAHLLDDPRRERGGKNESKEAVQDIASDAGFRHLKPYQDYACKLEGGGALCFIYANFVSAWDRAGKDEDYTAEKTCTSNQTACHNPPSELMHKALPGESMVRIVRTQPEEQDKSIKEMYWLATSAAATTAGYLYLENQYFQYEDWSKHLLDARRDAIKKWKLGCKAAGKSIEDLPILHVLIVIPAPERAQMIPRTHDALATLNQHQGMKGQNEMIDAYNAAGRAHKEQFWLRVPDIQPDVVTHANSIKKPSVMELESELGLKVCVSMLNTCGLENGRWRYREIYIHSKLMMSNDVFFTLGSANLNQRSMVVDSELNMGVLDIRHTKDLRRRVWTLLSGGLVDGDGDMQESFEDWSKLRKENKKRKLDDSEVKGDRKMTGFLLPFDEYRSSVKRLG